jgi:prepilin-type N-terminal cleavage/methylation domain-containing protein
MKKKRIFANYGFTLAELLIASSVGAIVAVAATQFLVDQVLQGRQLEGAQRVRENISRLNYLITIEASEADQISEGSDPPGCSGGASSFSLRIPRPTGQYANVDNVSNIQYYNADDEGSPSIWRCGPPVTRNGVLRHGEANVSGVVMRNAQLEFGGGCPSTTNRNVSYRIVPAAGSLGGSIGGLGDCTTAHARSIFICNPSVSLGEGVGDC